MKSTSSTATKLAYLVVENKQELLIFEDAGIYLRTEKLNNVNANRICKIMLFVDRRLFQIFTHFSMKKNLKIFMRATIGDGDTGLQITISWCMYLV